MSEKTVTQDAHDAMKEIFLMLEQYPKGMSASELETQKNYYLGITVVQGKPQQQIDLETTRSQTAQYRELTKVQEMVLANEQKILEAVALTKETIEKMYPLTVKN